jgi:hypothetical protein
MSDSNVLLDEDFSDISGDEFDDMPFEDLKIDNENKVIVYEDEDITKNNVVEVDDIFEADAHLLDLQIETQTLSLDEVSYNRDLKYINTASKDKQKLLLYQNSSNRGISRRDKKKTQLKHQEIKSSGKLYVDPDEIIKKKNDYDMNNVGSRSRRRKGGFEFNDRKGELIDVVDKKKKKNLNQKKHQDKIVVSPKAIVNNPNRMNRQEFLNQQMMENNANSHLYNNPYSNSMNIHQSNYYQNQGNNSAVHYSYPPSVPNVQSQVETNQIPLSQFTLRATASSFIPTFIPSSKPPTPPNV